MNPLIQRDFTEYAKAQAPKEACAFVVNKNGVEHLVPVENNHWTPEQAFLIRPENWAAATNIGPILSIVHSHPVTPAIASTADKVMCEESRLPWHIYSLESDTWAHLFPTGWKAPLHGREFIFGVLDCYSLVRDYYRERLNIQLNDYYREENFWKKGAPLYRQNFEKEGFIQVTDSPREHDVFLMQIGQSSVENHAAIFLGNGLILHHVHRTLSCTIPYGGMWMKHTTLTVRHKSLV